MNIQTIINFLVELDFNNNKDGFNEHKNDYQIANNIYSAIIEKFIKGIAKFDNSLQDLLPKQCIFRLNRDVRFSNDKTPYKNGFGAYINKGGRKNGTAGYYIHIQPQKSLIAAGLHIPKAEGLAAARQEIANNGDILFKIINAPKFKSIGGEFNGDKLKKAPRNFDPNDKYIELIKMKSFDVVHYYSDGQILNTEEGITDAIKKFKLIQPVNEFFNNAIR